MAIPLSQLMQTDDPDVGPPRAEFDICLAPKLAEELEAATARFLDLEARVEQAREEAKDPENSRRARQRVGQKPQLRELEQRAEEAAAEADEVRDRMLERSIKLHLVANENLWVAFTRAHPARDPEDDATGARRDRMYAFSLCDVDALQDELPKFITRYGDEQPTDKSWAFVKANSAAGQRDQLASKVVRMHTQGVDLGKSRTALHSSRKLATASE